MSTEGRKKAAAVESIKNETTPMMREMQKETVLGEKD